MDAGISASTKEVSALALEWKKVEAAAAQAGSVARRAGGIGGGIGGGVGGPRRLAGGGGSHGRRLHLRSNGIPIPGGHIGGSGAATAGVAALGYGLYEDAKLEDAVFQMKWHAGLENTPENSAMFRNLIQKTSSETGFNYHDIAEAATDEIRLMKGSPGNGIEILPEMLKAAATEARVKGVGLKEAMRSYIELAHMTKEYGLDDVKAMAPLIGFLSTANPATLPQMVKAASYAMPTLQSALGMDPADVLYETTAIARAGATNTKSGTWVRAAFERSLPPNAKTVGAREYEMRMNALREVGLVDAGGKSTVLDSTGKHLDIEKLLGTVYEKTKTMSLEDRNSYMKKVFGEQGERGMFLMMDPKVREQTAQLKQQYPDFKNHYDTFMEDYAQASPVQKFRTTTADLTNVLADIGADVLPAVNIGLNRFDELLRGIESHLPGAPAHGSRMEKAIGEAELWATGGAVAGGVFGAFAGGAGAVPGALLGGAVGGAAGFVNGFKLDVAPTEKAKPWYDGLLPSWLGGDSGAAHAAEAGKQSFNVIPPPNNTQVIAVSSVLKLDGQVLADNTQEIFANGTEHSTAAPYADGSRYPWGGDMQTNSR